MSHHQQSNPPQHDTRTLYIRLLLFSTTCFGRSFYIIMQRIQVHKGRVCRRLYLTMVEEATCSDLQPIGITGSIVLGCCVFVDWIAKCYLAQWDDVALTDTSVIFPKRTEFLGVRQFVLQYQPNYFNGACRRQYLRPQFSSAAGCFLPLRGKQSQRPSL